MALEVLLVDVQLSRCGKLVVIMLPFEELASLLIFIPTNAKEEDTGDIV